MWPLWMALSLVENFNFLMFTALRVQLIILKFQEGINELYLKVEWNKLTDILIWKSAAAQVFYSLATGQGVHLILASYNGFRTNCQRDSLLIGELFHSNNLQFIVIPNETIFKRIDQGFFN